MLNIFPHPKQSSSFSSIVRRIFNSRRISRLALTFLAIILLFSQTLPQRPVDALAAGDLTFTLITTRAPVDSVLSQCNAFKGPRAMYIQINVTNPAGGVGALTDLTFT